MKKILMIATGGTIASKNDGAGLTPSISSCELLNYVPEIAEICDVTTIQPINLDSTNIFYKHWIEIARIIKDNYKNYDGFLVTHGTDTMAYTAAALSYLVQGSRKPIVITGSQKSVCLRDTDARKNLLDAFTYCANDYAQGVHIVFDGNVILGTRAKKTHSRSYNAFTSVDYPVVAIVRDGKIVYYINEQKPTGEPKFFFELDHRVFVLKLFPSIDPSIFDYLVAHYDGIVLECFGTGGIPDYSNDEFAKRVKEFSDAGKMIVVSTQVEREGVSLNSYEVGRKLLHFGTIAETGCMTQEAATVKLMWALGQTKNQQECKKLFLTPIQYDIF